MQWKTPNYLQQLVSYNENTEPSIWGPVFRASSAIDYVALSGSLNFAETQFPFPDI